MWAFHFRHLEGFLSPSNATGHTTGRTRGEGTEKTRKSEAACIYASGAPRIRTAKKEKGPLMSSFVFSDGCVCVTCRGTTIRITVGCVCVTCRGTTIRITVVLRIAVVLRIRRSGVAVSRVAHSCCTFIAAGGVGATSPLFVVELTCQVGRTPTIHHSAHQRPSEVVVDYVVLVSAGTGFRAVVVHGRMPAGRHKRGCGRRQWNCREKDAIFALRTICNSRW